jgi:hypothetical protein
MGFMVDRLACITININENVTSSENKSFSWYACIIKKEFNG